ncbi:MAG: hypothetical protein WCO60_18535 [Verrucomicrobiota bacterium]
MIALAALPTFQRLFPNFQTQCTTLYTLLLPIAFVLLVAGLVGHVKQCSTPRSMVRPIISAMLVIMAIALFGEWTDLAKDALQTVVSKMDAHPEVAAQRYIEVLVAKTEPGEKHGWFGLPGAAEMYEAIVWGILTVVGLVAQFLIWVAYIIQQFLVGLSYAFAPFFLGLLALRSTSHIGARYILGTVGILAWPLGWAAASIATSNLIDVATEQGLVIATNVYGLQTIMAAATIGAWIILSTIIAPIVIQNAVSTGAQVGGALLGGALSAGAAALSAGTTTAASLATGGAGAAGMLAGAASAGAGSLAGSAMQGGGSSISGSMISSIAQSLPRAQSASSGSASSGATQSSGGNQQSQASSAPPFNPKDPSNDAEAECLAGSSQTAGVSK